MMNLLFLLTVLFTGGLCGDRRAPPAEASIKRIMGLDSPVNDHDVQWLMKQSDLMFIFVSNAFWQSPIEERANLIQVIERFVSATILGPLGVDIRAAAQVFERYRLEYLSLSVEASVIRYNGATDINPDISKFALSLAFDLEQHAPSLPSLLSDPTFPVDTDRRHLFAALSSIRSRLAPEYSKKITSFYLEVQSREYLEMLLDVYTRVEERYTRLCQETGVDVAATYRPMHLLRNISWGFDINEDEWLIYSLILPMINDPQIIDFAITVGQCLDFALRHHPFVPLSSSVLGLDYQLWIDEVPEMDSETVCRQLMTKGFRWLDVGRPPLLSGDVPTPYIDDGSVLTDFTDLSPPIPMEFADTTTIRVSRLVEVVALRVPEIREVFQLMDSPTFMSKFERILLKELDREDVRVDRLAYDLTRFLGIRILHLPMMREKYLSFLSVEQFEGLRRIISCLSHLELVVGSKHKTMAYIDFTLEHPDEIELMSRGLQALARLYKKFQEDPIRSGEYFSVARYRTMGGFFPASVVFSGSFGLVTINIDKLRQGLEWVIAHEWEFDFPVPSLNQIDNRKRYRLDDPSLRSVSEFHGGSYPEFDEMSFAIDRLFRRPLAVPLNWHHVSTMAPESLGRLGLPLPKRIFAAVMQLGGMEAIDAPLKIQLLRIVPLFVKLFTAITNGQQPSYVPRRSLYRVQTMLSDLQPTDAGKLERELNLMENSIPPPRTNPTLGPW